MSECAHENRLRVRGLYEGGRPVYHCPACDAYVVNEDDEPSFKALAPLRASDAKEAWPDFSPATTSS